MDNKAVNMLVHNIIDSMNDAWMDYQYALNAREIKNTDLANYFLSVAKKRVSELEDSHEKLRHLTEEMEMVKEENPYIAYDTAYTERANLLKTKIEKFKL